MITYLAKVTLDDEITEELAYIAMDENIDPNIMLGCWVRVLLVNTSKPKTARLDGIIREENIDERS